MGLYKKNLPVRPIEVPDRLTELKDKYMLKRSFDLCISIVGILFALPIGIIVGIGIRLTSAGPVLILQDRVGRNGETFVFYKFRTMYSGTPNKATHEVSQTSVTGLGHHLRRFKIDELPQLWNVIKGDMSLVGPRPCLTVQQELIAERHKHDIFSVRPGITGLAQINGIAMADPVLLTKWDKKYCSEQSTRLDFGILVSTFLGKGIGDKVGPAL